jgi:hypothetical protein
MSQMLLLSREALVISLGKLLKTVLKSHPKLLETAKIFASGGGLPAAPAAGIIHVFPSPARSAILFGSTTPR